MSNIDKQALREAAETATPGEWCSDDHHGVIADAGLNANYYIASCSGPDNRANKRFIAAANPATVLALLDDLEAAEQTSAARLEAIDRTHKMFQRERDRAEAAEKRISGLECSETHLIDERDNAETALNDAYKAAMGQAPEWSNWFGFADAIDEIELACGLWRNQTDDVIQFRARIAELEHEHCGTSLMAREVEHVATTDKLMARIAELDLQLSRYSMSAGEADQRKCESQIVREALGFEKNGDNVAPIDLRKRIAELESRTLTVKLPRSFNREIFGNGMYEVPNGNWMHRKDVTETLESSCADAGISLKIEGE